MTTGGENVRHDWKPFCCQTLKHLDNVFATDGNNIDGSV